MRGWPGAKQTHEAILCPDQNEMRLSRGPGPWEIQLGNPLSPLRHREGMGVETEPGRVQPVRERQDSHSREVGGSRGGGTESWKKGYGMGARRAVSTLDRLCPAHREDVCYIHVPVLHTHCMWVCSDLGGGQKSPELPAPAVQRPSSECLSSPLLSLLLAAVEIPLARCVLLQAMPTICLPLTHPAHPAD